MSARRTAAAAIAAVVLLVGAMQVSAATATTEPPVNPPETIVCYPPPDSTPVDSTPPGSILGSATLTTDIQVTGTTSAPQTLMTTAPIEFDGGPVVVEFTAQYLNHLPSSTTNLNGIAFDLMVDGVRTERIGFAGTHAQTNDFWPLVLRDVLDTAPRIIPAGTHTIGISISRWSAVQDGYIKYNAGYVTGWGMPIRLTVYAA